MSEIETMLASVWNPGSRPFVTEAWHSYNAGAIRASIAATWTAVSADIIAKIAYLADEGDAAAQRFTADVSAAQSHGLEAEGVRAMQTLESALLDEALKFELIDSIDKRGLDRVRQDRNLCVHPSLRPLSEAYVPRAEVARAHLAIALEALLVHPPTQGQKIIDRYIDFTCSSSFDSGPGHIQSAFFDRVRTATRRGIVNIAAKHAVLELDTQGRFENVRYAERSARVLAAIALRDRSLVRNAVVARRDAFRTADGDAQRRALGRLGDQDYFWDMLDEPLLERLNSLVAQPIQTPPYESLNPVTAATVGLVSLDDVRRRLPMLETQFLGMSEMHKANVIAARVHSYFVPHLTELLRRAYSWRFGDQLGALLVAYAEVLTLDDLAEALQACVRNDQCWRASGMPRSIAELFRTSSRLGHSRVEPFRKFLSTIQDMLGDSDDDYYRYPELRSALDQVS